MIVYSGLVQPFSFRVKAEEADEAGAGDENDDPDVDPTLKPRKFDVN